MSDDTSDERLGQSDDAPIAHQGRRSPRAHVEGTSRDSRHAAEREANERDLTGDRELTDAERLEMFRTNRYQSVLPDLPEFPGYHTCWLTTTNARDSIPNRLRQGYSLIRVSECPGWDGVGLRVGAVDNIVGVNEMVASKIPLHLYNLYMREAHHNQPLEEEGKLRNESERLAEQARSMGARVEAGDGMASLGERVAPPQFAG